MGMASQSESTLILSIRNRLKAISYSGSGQRPDGGQNYGFRPLKGKPEECALIAEVQDDIALKNALVSLNHSDSIFFTVACEKSCNQHSSGCGYWMKGYVEVAFSYKVMVQNAQCYFQLFYDFNLNWFWKQKQEAIVQCHFELEPTNFWRHQVVGFAMTVWIQTEVMPSEDAARNAWSWALNTFVDFMKMQTLPSGHKFTPMY